MSRESGESNNKTKSDHTNNCGNPNNQETSEDSPSLLETNNNSFKVEKDPIVCAEASEIFGLTALGGESDKVDSLGRNEDDKVIRSPNKDEISASEEATDDVASKSVADLSSSEIAAIACEGRPSSNIVEMAKDENSMPLHSENESPSRREGDKISEGPINATAEILKDECGKSLGIEPEVYTTPVEVSSDVIEPGRDISNDGGISEMEDALENFDVSSLSTAEESEKVNQQAVGSGETENLKQTVEKDDNLSSSVGVEAATVEVESENITRVEMEEEQKGGSKEKPCEDEKVVESSTTPNPVDANAISEIESGSKANVSEVPMSSAQGCDEESICDEGKREEGL